MIALLTLLVLGGLLFAAVVGGLLLYRAVRFRGLLAEIPILPRAIRFRFQTHTLLGHPRRTDRVLERDGFSVGYDYSVKAARWVSYAISAGSVDVGNEKVDRTDHAFHLDPEIPREHQLAPSDYTRTGFDRGHLVPSETVDFTDDACRQTFAMSNIVPQDPGLNRRAWRSLENDVRRWTEHLGRLVVVSGTVYADPPAKKKSLLIPSHFYKVVYSPDHHRCVGFLMPNEEIPAAKRWDYALPVAEIERAAGVRFFWAWYWLLRRPDRSESDVDWWRGKRKSRG